ncbi:unnamed protein product [Adineta steineri]|uniref:NHL repeat containing protein n=1 Tax=Adineta steineri TaxID=433720 RepID=A0A814ZVE7_9BILA|nr:unnamed protein product [Adineta steineri]CAF3991099.1 unnamed protein product [Adineta steineri]
MKPFILALSFNQPKFCRAAVWNPYGITFSDEITIGYHPQALFINMNNTVYTVNNKKKQILIWINNSINPNKIISVNISISYSTFVTNNGDIYYDNGDTYYYNDNESGRVNKWISNTNTSVNVMNVDAGCMGLFIDINDTLYCSTYDPHKVIKRWLNDSEMISTTAAGTGKSGNASNELYYPMGIFVDINLDLYVADAFNNRIQLFKQEELNGTTIVGQGSSYNIISLRFPSAIVLDADKYLFIVDRNNHRIIRSRSNDIRCIIGCDGEGSQSHQLSTPITLSFDSYGNIFIIDGANNRIQKFDFLPNSCDNSSIVLSMYSSELTRNHPSYSRTGCGLSNYYFEAIQVNVNESDYYNLNSKSSINIYGYMYSENFYPFGPSTNLILKNSDNSSKGQLQMRIFLQSTTANIFVITTYDPDVSGTFSIVVSGLNHVTFERLSEYL